MKMLTVSEFAKKWNISERSVRNYCNKGRIIGASLKGKIWYIPEDTVLPSRKVSKLPFNNILSILTQEFKSKIKGRLYYRNQIDFAYNSNHIEGSTLTKEQTRYIYETKTIGLEANKTIKTDDMIETINHFKCFDYLLKTINQDLNEKLIKEFHKILKSNTSYAQLSWFKIGDWKIMPNEVADQATVSPEKVETEMYKLLTWYLSIKNVTLNDILEFHVRFENIHPFQDGNGRVGRLIMFRECLRHNIVPFIISDDVRLFYYRGIKNWKKQKGFLTDTCLKCQDDYKALLDYLKIKY